MDRTEQLAYVNGAERMLELVLEALGDGRGTRALRNQVNASFVSLSREVRKGSSNSLNSFPVSGPNLSHTTGPSCEGRALAN